MKRKLIFVSMLVLFSIGCGLFPKDQVSAWWGNGNDGKKCFSIQYKYAKKYENNGKTSQDNGETERTAAQLYSTKKVCASLDNNGNVKGKIEFQGYPKDTSKITVNNEKLKMSINKEGTELTISTCSKTGYACENGSDAVTTTTLKVSDGTFESFARSAHAAAPAQYGNATKVGFDEDLTKEDVKKEADAMGVNEGSGDDDDSGDNKIKETCANQGGAQSLGWIVCPIMELLGDASEDIYAEYVEPALTVDPKLFSDENESVRHGWETFRDIANILFVILLLIVIFSQLTGVGIDNYGIKKILPKLIVVAVLINLSFVICVLAVDISNILGNSFQALFNGLGDTLPSPESINVAEDSIIPGSSAEGALVSVGVLGAAVVAGGMMWKNPAIVLSLLISALGVFISIIFLFLMLAVREAAVVVLIVISPVAMVCYMLPNVKKYFDRWLKGFQGLLLVYPICGLMVGGGNYVAKLLLTAGFAHEGFFSAFTAMIAGIVPIFFIPTLLKNSFTALGDLGGKIAGLGNRMSAGSTRAIRNTEGYKSLQRAGYNRKTRINAGLDRDGRPTRIGAIKAGIAGSGLGRALGYQSLQSARVAAAQQNLENEIKQGASLGDLAFQREKMQDPTLQEEDYYRRQLAAAASRGSQKDIMTALAQMNGSNLQDSRKADITRSVLGNRANFGNMSDADRRNTLEEVGKQYGNGFLTKDFEQKRYMMSGGVGRDANGNAAFQDLDGYAENNLNVDDLKDEDVLALSTEQRANLMSQGIISSAQSQRIWASNANMDDAARLQLGAHGNENVVLSKSEAQGLLSNDPNSTMPRRISQEKVQSYTRRSAESVVIEDVRLRDANGRNQQTDTLHINH